MQAVCFSGNLCLEASLLAVRLTLVIVPRESFSSNERWRNRFLEGVNSSKEGSHDQSNSFLEGSILSWCSRLASWGVGLRSAGNCAGVYVACSVRGSAFRRIELLNIYNGTPLVLERYVRRRGHDTKNVYFYQREDFS